MRFSNSVVIRRTPADVYNFLANPDNIPRWNHAIGSARTTIPGPLTAGSWLELSRAIPRPGVDRLEVTEVEPYRRLVLRGDVGPLHGTLDYVLQAVPEGTRLTNAADLQASGLAGIFEAVVSKQVRSAVQDNLEVLRSLVEDAPSSSR